jgi:uncharacterized protein (TIGR00725 family)
MKTTVFGGSHASEGSAAYAEALQLGRSLALLGHTVLTGGYIGTMEAVSRGAAEAGGHVIGVTCVEIERWHEKRTVNRWVKEEWKKETLVDRLEALVRSCDAALALPGGPGTLTEIALAWNLMIIDAIPEKPLILIGEGWQAVLAEFWRRLGNYTPESQRRYVQFAPDAEAAVRMLAEQH